MTDDLIPTLSAAADHDWILIDGLEFEAIIGIHPDERVNPQPLIIDLRLGVASIEQAVATESIDATVDYQRVCETVMALVHDGAFHLVETLAERAVAALFERFPLDRIVIRVRKPLALPYTRGVGVLIDRRRPERQPPERPGDAEPADNMIPD